MSKKRWRVTNSELRQVRLNFADGSYRPRARILIGSLAGIALVCAVVAACCYFIPGPTAREDRLKQELAAHIRQSDWENAMERLHSLQQIAPDDNQLVFQEALVEKSRGNETVANQLIGRLVEERHAGAALLEIERNINQFTAQLDDTAQERLEELVEIAAGAEDLKTSVRARQHLATNRIQAGALDEALVILEELSQSDTSFYLHVASVAKRLGLIERSRGAASIARQHYFTQLSLHPRDDQCRLNLVRAHVLLEEESVALKLLSDGFALTQQPKFQQAAGETMICWANRLQSKDVATVFARARLVHRATQCAPNDPAVLAALVGLLAELMPQSDFYKAQLRTFVAQGSDVESGHFTLGLLALLEKDVSGAKLHLDLAEEAGSHVATVLNNLAIAVLDDRRLSIEHGFEVACEAIRRMPSEPRFRETRSRFSLREEKYDAAIEDLLIAAQVAELKPFVYKNLVLAYQAIGDDVSAQKYLTVEVQ